MDDIVVEWTEHGGSLVMDKQGENCIFLVGF